MIGGIKLSREIKFRAKSLLTGEWVCGYYYNLPDGLKGKLRHIIVYENKGFGIQTVHEPVDVDTLGQYTGLEDKNDKEIFEGDIVKAHGNDTMFPEEEAFIGEVVYDDTQCCFELRKEVFCEDFEGIAYEACPLHGFFIEVLGNVFENPELLEVV